MEGLRHLLLSPNAGHVMGAGASARLLLLAWSAIQDKFMTVKYTDVDYLVFSDAARSVAEGGSPYDRATYRYSPILAFLLLPNTFLHPAWGKLLFTATDMLIARYALGIQMPSRPYNGSQRHTCPEGNTPRL
jgi:hypothetical protein